jgi:MOSC domain-containing protein YiiM
MTKTAAKLNQADIARAIRAAKQAGMAVRILPDGSIEIVERAADDSPIKPVAARREIRV